MNAADLFFNSEVQFLVHDASLVVVDDTDLDRVKLNHGASNLLRLVEIIDAVSERVRSGGLSVSPAVVLAARRSSVLDSLRNPVLFGGVEGADFGDSNNSPLGLLGRATASACCHLKRGSKTNGDPKASLSIPVAPSRSVRDENVFACLVLPRDGGSFLGDS